MLLCFRPIAWSISQAGNGAGAELFFWREILCDAEASSRIERRDILSRRSVPSVALDHREMKIGARATGVGQLCVPLGILRSRPPYGRPQAALEQ